MMLVTLEVQAGVAAHVFGFRFRASTNFQAGFENHVVLHTLADVAALLSACFESMLMRRSRNSAIENAPAPCKYPPKDPQQVAGMFIMQE